MSDGERVKPNCARCVEYFITYDAQFPYGCRALGFKSRRLPQDEILAASGTPCEAFRPKPPVQRNRD